MEDYKLTKLCPNCLSKQSYSQKKCLYAAIKNNTLCKRCSQKGKVISDETKLKISENHVGTTGKIFSDKTRDNMSKNHVGFVGKKHSDLAKERIRILKLERVKMLGGNRTYNPTACKFIDDFGKKNGYNFQHAMNGGEVMVSGYSLDGYDKEKNVVFEYDEPRHQHSSHKQKDIIRQKRIINKINPTTFLRYDEKTGKLYDVIISKNVFI